MEGLNRKYMLKRIREFFNKSIQNKLIISFLVIIFLPILIISFFSYNKLVNFTKSNYERDNIEILKTLDKNLQVYLEEFNRITYNAILSNKIKDLLYSDSNDLETRVKNQWDFEELASNAVGDRSDVEGVYLVNSQKYVYSKSANTSINLDYDLTNDAWYKRIEHGNGKFVVVGSHKISYKYGFGNKYVITVGREIMDFNTKKKIGFFFINLKQDMFYNLFKGINKAERNIILVDNENNIVFDQDEANIMKQFSDAYLGLDIKSTGNRIKTKKYGEVYLISSHSTSFDWMFVEIIPVKKLLIQLYSITIPILSVAFVCFVVFILSALYISRDIVLPLKLLEKSMEKVEKGDFTQKVDTQAGGEVGILAAKFNRMVEKIQELIVKVYETQLKKLDSEYKALQAQINPHFLYNTLQSIDCLAQIKEEHEISEMIRGLAKIFRYSISEDGNFVTLGEEIQHVKNYVLLQAIRYDERFDISYNVPEDLLEAKVVKIMLQPLVENVLYHGLENIDKKGKIQICAYLYGKNMIIEVMDNGLGIDNEKLEKLSMLLESSLNDITKVDYQCSSIGIFNIHLRIKLLYGNDYGLKLESTKGKGTVVKVVLPINKDVNGNV
jgi:two-component system, sensor histidine kinase YesM